MVQIVERDIEEINVIPLVDVMLVLLVIVLTTASFISTAQIPVNLAKARNAQTAEESPIKVTIRADGSIFFGARQVAVEELPAVLEGIPRQAQVIVWADHQILLQRFVSVVDAIKGQGFDRISLRVNTQ